MRALLTTLAVLGLTLRAATAQDFEFGNVTAPDQTPSFVAATQVQPTQPVAPTPAAPVMTGDQIGYYFSDTTFSLRYVQVEGVAFHRAGVGARQMLAFDTGLPPGVNGVLETNDLKFDLSGGVRAFVGWYSNYFPHVTSFEVGYLGLYGAQASTTATGPGNLAIPGALGLASNNFLFADVITADYASTLNSIEMNAVKSEVFAGDTRLDVLAGLRYLRVDETFKLAATDFTEGTSSYDIATANNLFGGQLGGRFTRAWDLWRFEFSGKAGLYVNAAYQRQVVTDSPFVGGPFLLRAPISATGAMVASVMDLGFSAVRPINDVWSFRIGYMALGVSGLALATDQLDFTNTFVSGGDLNANGYAFYHGGTAGLEARW